MCIGIPGKVVQIEENAAGVKIGKVSYGDETRSAVLSIVPDVQVGDYVMVNYGLATSRLSEAEANDILKFEDDLDRLMFEEERQ